MLFFLILPRTKSFLYENQYTPIPKPNPYLKCLSLICQLLISSTTLTTLFRDLIILKFIYSDNFSLHYKPTLSIDLHAFIIMLRELISIKLTLLSETLFSYIYIKRAVLVTNT